jgi:predicted nucleic acid-binding protein
MYCIDASVLIAAFDESDVFHDTSLQMLDFIDG